MKKKHIIAGVVVGLAALGTAISSSSSHVASAEFYPDHTLTPGKAETLSHADLVATYTDHCPNGKSSCTYSEDHRDVNQALHTRVYDEYKVPAEKRNRENGEVDHFYPLCAGGSNDISNLWYQPAVLVIGKENWGYRKKDDLETYVCHGIKTGQIDPKEAYKRITSDWVKYYQELFGSGRLGAFAAEDMEGDTE